MTFAERFLPKADQMQLLREAAESKQGLIALVIPMPPDYGQEAKGTDRHLPSSPNPCADHHADIRVSAISLAEKFIRLRRQREKIFPPELFADPSWDMLLDLYVARSKGMRPVSTSSLCIAAAVPATTALRWIAQLVQQGLFCKYPDPTDGRKTYIRLTEEGWQKMHGFLTVWAEKI